jgi:hypothetical protein
MHNSLASCVMQPCNNLPAKCATKLTSSLWHLPASSRPFCTFRVIFSESMSSFLTSSLVLNTHRTRSRARTSSKSMSDRDRRRRTADGGRDHHGTWHHTKSSNIHERMLGMTESDDHRVFHTGTAHVDVCLMNGTDFVKIIWMCNGIELGLSICT